MAAVGAVGVREAARVEGWGEDLATGEGVVEMAAVGAVGVRKAATVEGLGAGCMTEANNCQAQMAPALH